MNTNKNKLTDDRKYELVAKMVIKSIKRKTLFKDLQLTDEQMNGLILVSIKFLCPPPPTDDPKAKKLYKEIERQLGLGGEDKIYKIETSAHGINNWVADNKLYTLEEAIQECKDWSTLSDTVGGDARIINVLTGKEERWC